MDVYVDGYCFVRWCYVEVVVYVYVVEWGYVELFVVVLVDDWQVCVCDGNQVVVLLVEGVVDFIDDCLEWVIVWCVVELYVQWIEYMVQQVWQCEQLDCVVGWQVCFVQV